MKKILFISPTIPEASDSGGAHRSHYLFTELRQIAEVHVCTCSPTGIPHDKAKKFAEHNIYLGNIPIPRRFSFSLERHRLAFPLMEALKKRDYDYIFVRYLHSAYWLNLLQHESLILDCDDCQLELLQQMREHCSGMTKLLAWYYLKKFASKYQECISRIPLVIYARHSPLARSAPNAVVIPNKVLRSAASDRAIEQRPRQRHTTVLFVGLLSYPPNHFGLDQFIKHSWPNVLEEVPDVRLKVVGAKLPKRFARKWSRVANVDVCGYVPSLDDVYADVDFCISPVSVGSGTHIKVLESLSRGKTMVVSTRSHRGFEETLKDGESLLVARDFKDFARKVCDLVKDVPLRERLSQMGRSIVEQSFTYDASTRSSMLADLLVG